MRLDTQGRELEPGKYRILWLDDDGADEWVGEILPFGNHLEFMDPDGRHGWPVESELFDGATFDRMEDTT